jgi:hypothetical protein
MNSANAVTFQASASIGDRVDQLVARGVLQEVAQTSTKPAGVPELSIDEVESKYATPWYKRWWVWAIGGLTVTGIGLSVYLIRRRRR